MFWECKILIFPKFAQILPRFAQFYPDLSKFYSKLHKFCQNFPKIIAKGFGCIPCIPNSYSTTPTRDVLWNRVIWQRQVIVFWLNTGEE